MLTHSDAIQQIRRPKNKDMRDSDIAAELPVRQVAEPSRSYTWNRLLLAGTGEIPPPGVGYLRSLHSLHPRHRDGASRQVHYRPP
jgi:hypothetical protein